MNKLLMLGVAAMSMAVAAPAMAGDGHHKGKDLFAVHDADGDGTVTKAEFLAGAEKKFAEMDTDSDGAISKAEHEARKAAWMEKMKERRAKAKESMENKEAPPEAPAAE